jgi:hypothetical protein
LAEKEPTDSRAEEKREGHKKESGVGGEHEEEEQEQEQEQEKEQQRVSSSGPL